MLSKKKTTLRKIQSLVGTLNIACCIIQSGRAFRHHLIDLTCGKSHPKHHINLKQRQKADLIIWLAFLRHYNGKGMSLFAPQFSDIVIDCDASQSIGYGATCQNHFIHGLWPTHWKTYSIPLLELFPIP